MKPGMLWRTLGGYSRQNSVSCQLNAVRPSEFHLDAVPLPV